MTARQQRSGVAHRVRADEFANSITKTASAIDTTCQRRRTASAAMNASQTKRYEFPNGVCGSDAS